MLKINEPGTKPRPGVLLGGEPGNHSRKALAQQVLTVRHGVSQGMAAVLAPLIWEGARHG